MGPGLNAEREVGGQARGHDLIGDELDALPDDGPDSGPDAGPVPDDADARRNRLRRRLLVLVPLIALIAGLAYYLTTGRYESTEDAYVDAGQVTISSKVSGTVVALEVHENQQVRKGQVLFRLDPATLQAVVDEAEAELAKARLAVSATRASYGEGQSELASGMDRLAFARRELARQKALLAEGIASQSQYDRAALELQQAGQAIQSITNRNEGVLAQLSGDPQLPVEKQADVMRARAALLQAQLRLNDSVIRAPQDGIVTKVNQLQLGSHITANQPLFTLVGRHVWVEANFKEDQLNHMRVGQRATITIDAYPDAELTGHVASFSPGTGSSFAILPAENATGNWVKVVQRLPVEIALDNVPKGLPLHAGLSAEVTVDTENRRHLFGPDTQTETPGK